MKTFPRINFNSIKKSSCLSVVYGLLVCAVLAGSPASAESPLSLVFENETFGYNEEHTLIDSIQDGQTLIGDILKSYFRYRPKELLTIETGVLVDIPFGEDDRVQSVDPIISMHYDFVPGWRATGGTIDRNHPLHDAFFNDNLRYIEPIEQGFQIKGDTEHIRQDLWISWEEIETATRREKLSVGNYTQVKFKGFMLDGQIYWVHKGGQRNSGPGVFDNISLGVGGGYSFSPKDLHEDLNFFDEFGFKAHYLYNKDDPPGTAATVDEDGVAGEVFMNVWDAYVYFLFWKGGSQNFNSSRGDSVDPGVALAKGDPFYKADEFQEAGIRKTWWLTDDIGIAGDFRAQFILDRFVQIYAVSFIWRGEFPLFEDYFAKGR